LLPRHRPGDLEALEAVHDLQEALPERASTVDTDYGATFRKLLKVVWMALFRVYFHLKEQS
jgi:hypothetical protein